MSAAPTVTVVLTSFNYERFLAEAIRSAWKQTLRPLEIIVTDDGSTDGSVALAEAMAAQSPVPMRVLSGPHVGLHESLNRSLRAASGDLVSLLASDDRMNEDFLRRQVQHFTEDPTVVIAHCEHLAIDAAGAPLPFDAGSSLPPATGHCLEALVRGRCTFRTGPVFRRQAVLEFGGFDPTYPQEDWSFYLRCASRGPVAHTPARLMERRIHGANWSSRAVPQRWSNVYLGAAVPVLEEFASSPEVLDEALVFHVGVPLRAALFSGAFPEALDILQGASAYRPSVAPRLRRVAVRGLAAWAWRHTGRRVLRGAALTAAERRLRRALGV